MPRPKSFSSTSEYICMVQSSNQHGEAQDCSVHAVALLAGVSYETAHKTLADLGRMPCKGVSTHLIMLALEKLGCAVEEVRPHTMVAQYPAPHCNVLRHVTTHHPDRFPKVWSKMPGNVMMFTRGHVLSVINGRVCDWTRGKAKRVYAIYTVSRTQELTTQG